MKCKKALSLLLAAVMTIGMLPVSAMAAPAEKANAQNGTTIEGATTPYVDESADPNKSYEYTVTGSDGSTQTVVVPAANAEPTENSVTSKEVPGASYYGKLKDLSKLTGEPTLMVYQYSGTWYVLNNKGTWDSSLALKNAPGDRIVSDGMESYEWTVSKNKQNQLKFTQTNSKNFIFTRWTRAGQPLVVIGNNERDGRNPWFNASLDTNGGTSLWNTVSGHDVCLAAYGNLTVENGTASTKFYLYQKMTNSAGTQYTVNTTGLDKLLNQSFNQNIYTEDSWKTYADAKAAAEAAKKALNNPYTDKGKADKALVKIDNATRKLDAAIKGLTKKPAKPVEPGTCVKPEITWHRTWENNTYGEKPVQGVQYLESGNWQNITWQWNQIKNLTASDPNPWNHNGNAATWSKGNWANSSWTDASVRRFTGTFTWPAGVGMDATATIQSVNDQNYQFIYDYIDRDPQLKERYGNAKVLPINDDMYVFISKVSDGEPSTWDAQKAKDRLAFWTGTSGKGIWSWYNHTGDDWSRTEPAQFQGKNATPAYHGSWPNLVDTGKGDNTSVQTCNMLLDSNGNATSLMKHSDAWYTLTDTNAMMSTLNELYGATANLAGEEMRIDVYAFDNSGDGGMDELELILCAAEQTTAQVQVNYWLDNVGATSLGSTVMTKKIGETVNLANGTNTNELNHKKAEAIRIAGASADVSNGTQVEKDFVVQKSGNVINVVYTRTIQGVKYFTYDFGVQNQYIYEDENSSAIQSVRVECATDTIGATFSGHNITLTYTPKDALGSFVQATLVVERKNNTNRYEIGFIPASNVLYEENFISNSGWTESGSNSVKTVSDNGDNVYGHTASYNEVTGANGIYTTTVKSGERNTNELKFSFRGLGLDLIGSCGPNYGNQMVKIMQGTKVVKAYVVYTGYEHGVIHQVPLLHTQAGLVAGAQYDVTIRASYAAPAPAVSTMSVDGGNAMTPEIYEELLDLGLTEADMDKVEFVNAVDNLPENAVSTFAAEPATATGEQTVAVDSFRVYRSTEKAAVAYAENEQNLIYTNVMDEAITGEFSAYVEKDSQTGKFTTKTYEGKGGPENELYLKPNTGISFKLDTSKVGTAQPYAQVSLRAVDQAASWNNQNISHNTEMYYEATVDNKGLVTISNTGDTLLAVGNLKTNCKIVSMSDQDKANAVEAVALMFAQPEKPSVPQKFHVNFTLADGAVWKDGTNGVDTVDLTMEDGAVMAPSVQLPEGKKFVGWKADQNEIVLADREALTAQYLQENFTWAEAEPTITFTLVLEDVAPEKPQAFEPAVFDVQISATNRLKGKKQVNLDVTASFDVAKLTVNGREIKPNNMFWVKLGLADEYTYRVTKNMNRSETATFHVVAYNADGLASETVTMTK